jgi:hypothetical protein
MPIRKLYDNANMDQNLDLRGWILKDEQGAAIGRVEELLVDSDAGKIRYAVATLPRRILLPVGLLDLNDQDRSMTARGYTRQLLGTLTEYEDTELTGDVEKRHFAETVTMGKNTERVGMDRPVDYQEDCFEIRNKRMQELEERFREVEARRMSRPARVEDRGREMTFSASEPTREELKDREAVDIERPTTVKKTIIDIRPSDDR